MTPPPAVGPKGRSRASSPAANPAGGGVSRIKPARAMSAAAWPGVAEAYRAFLPLTSSSPIVTLLEGNTPLVPSPWLSQADRKSVV